MIPNQISITHPDKILFPVTSYTKKDIIDYYEKISSYILPYMKHRPLVMRVFPNGIKEAGFYLKNKPNYFPDWIKSIEVEKKSGGKINHIVCDDKKTLIYLINKGCITLHTFLSQEADLNHPDQMIFDLDPSTDDYRLVKKGALKLKEVLDGFNLRSNVMLTGSEGCHIIVPIIANLNFDQVRDIANMIAEKVIKAYPNAFTLEQRKERRGDKVFIDTLRNAYGQTSVTPYALRPKDEATVATPISWRELKRHPFNPRKYTIKNIFRRLGQIQDPWDQDNQKNDIQPILDR